VASISTWWAQLAFSENKRKFRSKISPILLPGNEKGKGTRGKRIKHIGKGSREKNRKGKRADGEEVRRRRSPKKGRLEFENGRNLRPILIPDLGRWKPLLTDSGSTAAGRSLALMQ